ncbi:MAG: hypothetical protein JSW22_05490 [Chloroflexota bacterium]|nr:MAG: hypothetical protein JSW22_05490 [Chloroflexota bacterium]
MKMIPSSERHHLLAGFSIFLIVTTFIVGAAGCNGGNDSPLPQNLEIRDWYDLGAIRDNLLGNHILMNDLDSATAGYIELASPTANGGKGWQSIGSIAVNDTFVGSFDGQRYEIRDLFINRSDESDVGLFGVIEAGGVIENVGVINGNITGYEAVGILVGYNRGTVRNSYAFGNMAGDLDVGGLVGVNGGTVNKSHSTSSVTGGDRVGGLVGKNEGSVSNSYSAGTINGSDYVGDLVGVNVGTVSNSYADGTVHGSNSVGGLLGRNEGAVSKCYSTGNVSGDEHIGGLVGQNLYGVVSNSFWDTLTSGQGSSDGGSGKTTAEMQDVTTFIDAGWNITAVDLGETSPTHTWNIVDTLTYPYLSWQSAA